jgi:hypothetical protein
MAKPVPSALSTDARGWSRSGALAEAERPGVLRACREVTESLYDGLDLSQEIRAAQRQGIGDTVLLWDAARLVGFAVCHFGAGSEAGAGRCYVKFGAVRPGTGVAQAFDRLLDACEAVAAAEGLAQLVAGTNTARHEAYRALLGRGFRSELIGLAMQRPNEPGYHRPDAYVADDWR